MKQSTTIKPSSYGFRRTQQMQNAIREAVSNKNDNLKVLTEEVTLSNETTRNNAFNRPLDKKYLKTKAFNEDLNKIKDDVINILAESMNIAQNNVLSAVGMTTDIVDTNIIKNHIKDFIDTEISHEFNDSIRLGVDMLNGGTSLNYAVSLARKNIQTQGTFDSDDKGLDPVDGSKANGSLDIVYDVAKTNDISESLPSQVSMLTVMRESFTELLADKTTEVALNTLVEERQYAELKTFTESSYENDMYAEIKNRDLLKRSPSLFNEIMKNVVRLNESFNAHQDLVLMEALFTYNMLSMLKIIGIDNRVESTRINGISKMFKKKAEMINA